MNISSFNMTLGFNQGAVLIVPLVLLQSRVKELANADLLEITECEMIDNGGAVYWKSLDFTMQVFDIVQISLIDMNSLSE